MFVFLILWYIKCFFVCKEDGFLFLYDDNDFLISFGLFIVWSGFYLVFVIEIIVMGVDISNKLINDVNVFFL